MALLKFLKKSSVLPHPNGPLSEQVPSSSIAAANKEVKSLVVTPVDGTGVKRGRSNYGTYSDEERARVGKCASEMGVANTLRFFKDEFVDHPLKESTVRGWKVRYEQELIQRVRIGKGEEAITTLVNEKRGHPFLLGGELGRRLQEYIKELREAGGVINSAIVEGAALGIIKEYNSNLLQCNGGHIVIGKSWSKSFLNRMGYVKRRATTRSKVTPADFEGYKNQFILDVMTISVMEDIPKELIINWDHTGISYIPVSSWTMEKEGATRVEVAGVNDKRQLTAVFANTMSGDFLPPQLFYAGKTTRCLPKSVNFPRDWHVTFTANHWANEATTEDYINFILVPYIAKNKM